MSSSIKTSAIKQTRMKVRISLNKRIRAIKEIVTIAMPIGNLFGAPMKL
jgi:hypothetical protein